METRTTATGVRIELIRRSLTFHYIGAASIVLMSHLGRPDGHKVEKYSLKPVVSRHVHSAMVVQQYD